MHACICMNAFIHTYMFVVVNFDALAQVSDFRIERRLVAFLCWEQDSDPGDVRHLFASRLNACWQTDWAIEDQAKNLNSTARPYDQQAFSPSDPTAIWHSHLALEIYIFVVVNFDALAQVSDFRIERRLVVFLCWEQDSNPGDLRHLFASRLNACWQTDWAIEDQAKNLNSTARPYDQQAFSPPDPTAIWHSHLALAIYIFVVVIFENSGRDITPGHFDDITKEWEDSLIVRFLFTVDFPDVTCCHYQPCCMYLFLNSKY